MSRHFRSSVNVRIENPILHSACKQQPAFKAQWACLHFKASCVLQLPQNKPCSSNLRHPWIRPNIPTPLSPAGRAPSLPFRFAQRRGSSSSSSCRGDGRVPRPLHCHKRLLRHHGEGLLRNGAGLRQQLLLRDVLFHGCVRLQRGRACELARVCV